MISTYVDDILQITNAQSSKDELHQGLLDVYNSVTYDEKAISYLGMNLTRSDDGHIIEVTQSGSIAELLHYTLTEKDSVCKTPHIEELFLSSQVEELLDPSQAKRFLV